MMRSRTMQTTLYVLTATVVSACTTEGTGPEPVGTVPETLDPGLYRLQAVHSGLCVEVAGSSTDNGTNVQQGDCNSGENQKWELREFPAQKS